MEKDLHNDNFEDFFKKHLESFDDEPSDEMWERIEPVIPPKPGIIWSAYAWQSALILSVALLVFVGVKMLDYKQTSETLTEELEKSNREIQSLAEQKIMNDKTTSDQFNENRLEENNVDESILNIKTEHTKTNNTIISNDKNSITNSTKLLPIDQNINYGNENTINKNTITNSTKLLPREQNINYNNENTIINQNINVTSNADETPKTLLPNEVNTSNILKELTPENTENESQKPQATLDKVLDISPLAMRYSDILSNNNWAINQQVTVEKPLLKTKNENNRNKNHLMVFVAPTILKNNIDPLKSNGNPPPPPSHRPKPIPTETVNIGKAIGIKYRRDLTSKLSINIGGMYENTTYDFQTQHFLPYNKDSEQDLGTDKVSNNIDYSGASTYGDYKIDLEVTRQRNNAINQNEEIDIEVKATAEIHSIVIPAYVTYNVFEKKGFSVALKGGMSYNKILQNDMRVNDFKINRRGFEIKDVKLGERPKPSEKMSFNLISGIALAYQFNDKFSLAVEPTWSSALSDNHKSDFGRTKSNVFNVDIGLQYNF